jgi:N-acyl-D-amino-acid deacylase
MDSHGAWIVSAIDLVRFASAFDEPSKCHLLKQESIAQMFAPPQTRAKYGSSHGAKFYYSLGWMNEPANDRDQIDSWHNGSLPGTATLLLRRHDGRNVAILFNARFSPTTPDFGPAIKGQILQALDKVTDWPTIDLFEKL